jgi:UDP-N-acetylglucosamine 2-epimerase (non-hydrolysing)/GDP/UDP-N,N'-diacetylbacillosamine 2-epimerase (hydrolysing)
VAISQEFRRSLRGMENPYGDGHAAERIVSVLTSVPLGEELLIKRAPAVEISARELSQ